MNWEKRVRPAVSRFRVARPVPHVGLVLPQWGGRGQQWGYRWPDAGPYDTLKTGVVEGRRVDGEARGRGLEGAWREAP